MPKENKSVHLENSLIIYGVYNAETLEKLVKTTPPLHSRKSLVENLFAGQTASTYEIYSQMQKCAWCSTLCNESFIIFTYY